MKANLPAPAYLDVLFSNENCVRYDGCKHVLMNSTLFFNLPILTALDVAIGSTWNCKPLAYFVFFSNIFTVTHYLLLYDAVLPPTYYTLHPHFCIFYINS